MDGPDAPRALAAIFAVAGAAHLAKRRFFDSLVPDRLDPFRREIEIAAGSMQVAGAVALFVPQLRQSGRWLTVPLQAVTLIAAVDNLRHPDRIRRDHVRLPGAGSLVSGARIPLHATAIVLIWWATRAASPAGHAEAMRAAG